MYFGEYQAPSLFEAYVKLYEIPSAGHLVDGSDSIYLREII
jgi:hypothetical protein